MSVYSSFLIRCWVKRGTGATPTYVAQHAQSGEEVRSSSLDEVFDWVRRRSEEEPQPDAGGEEGSHDSNGSE